MSLLDNLQGDWGPDLWSDSNGTVANNGPQVVANDVLTQSVVTQGQDRWTGFFQGLVGTAAKYAVDRDAAKRGLVQSTASNGQPVYTAQPSALGMGSSGLLLIGVAVVAALVIATHKG